MSRLPACPSYFVFLLTNLIFIPSYLTASLFRCIHIANNPIKRPLYSFFYSGRPTWKVKHEKWKVVALREKWVLVVIPEISMKVCKNASMQVFWVQNFLPKYYLAQTFSNRANPAACASSELLRACFMCHQDWTEFNLYCHFENKCFWH